MKQRILLKGKDGIDLLQRITTLDFTRLLPLKAQPGLILNPQGKIICFFKVTPHDAKQEIEVEFNDSFLELLDQYTFGEKYQIEKLEPLTTTKDASSELKRIMARIPKQGNEFLPNGETNPLEINFNQAIHDQKGCYPGQEVVEKIIAIGSPAKKLCLVKLINGDTSSINLPLELEGGVGKLTSFESNHGLAIIRKTNAMPGTNLKAGTLQFQIIES